MFFFEKSSKQKWVIKIVCLCRRQFPPDLVERLEEVGLEGEERLEATEEASQNRSAGSANLLAKSEDGIGGLSFFLHMQKKQKSIEKQAFPGKGQFNQPYGRAPVVILQRR